jgi:hypothetical protein
MPTGCEQHNNYLTGLVRGSPVKYLLGLAIALCLTIAWQTMSLQERDATLKSVEHGEPVNIPPQAS